MRSRTDAAVSHVACYLTFAFAAASKVAVMIESGNPDTCGVISPDSTSPTSKPPSPTSAYAAAAAKQHPCC